jgi:hypothetical protein
VEQRRKSDAINYCTVRNGLLPSKWTMSGGQHTANQPAIASSTVFLIHHGVDRQAPVNARADVAQAA